jgi:hypothetical protein
MMSPAEQMFLDVNFRVNPNTDMVGGSEEVDVLRRPADHPVPHQRVAAA